MFSMPEQTPDAEPTAAELASIEKEWPQIAADVAALDAHIKTLTAAERVNELDVRRARRATRRVLRPVARTGSRFGGEAA